MTGVYHVASYQNRGADWNPLPAGANKDSQVVSGRVPISFFYIQIIHFNRVFHYKPSNLGYPYFWNPPYEEKHLNICTSKSSPWLAHQPPSPLDLLDPWSRWKTAGPGRFSRPQRWGWKICGTAQMQRPLRQAEKHTEHFCWKRFGKWHGKHFQKEILVEGKGIKTYGKDVKRFWKRYEKKIKAKQ